MRLLNDLVGEEAAAAASAASGGEANAAEASSRPPLRILAVAELWQGSNAYAYVRAFRRMGHSVSVVPSENYVPGRWQRRPLRALRRALEPVLVREYTNALLAEARHLAPHLFFVFKGHYVTAEAIRAIQRLGAVAVNFYPDVSFLAHGKYIPEALPAYDWVFTTKTFGLDDMRRQLGVRHASFLPHSFDPEVHFPARLTDEEKGIYGCDVSFIGTWSPEKQRLLEHLRAELPSARLRIWGAQWEAANSGPLGPCIEGRHTLGREYAKAICGSKINLGLLAEAREGSSNGDQITSRTFHIPATGGFLVHERTNEFAAFFEEGKECACFATPDELVEKISYYLGHAEEREAVAAAGRRRCVESGYDVDTRAGEVLKKVAEVRESREETART
jgi:glycosyltransferase involved in cell wall biosynthesis